MFSPLIISSFVFAIAQNSVVKLGPFIAAGQSTTNSANYGDITVNIAAGSTSGGTLRLTSGSGSNVGQYYAGTITVNPLTTLWVDGANIGANYTVFSANADGSNPSYYQYTINSGKTGGINTLNVVYKGALVLGVTYSWDGSVVTPVTATYATGTTFSSATGTPGYIYSQSRMANNLQVTGTQNAPITVFPTQSNGPAPPVSSSSIVAINFALLATLFFFVFFN